MISLTRKERESLLILFKDFTSYYNANSLSKVLGISHAGTQKMLKRFKEQNLTATKKIGKSIVYKLKLDDDYKKKLISFLLADEANNFKRWKEEFKTLFKDNRVVMIYGSIIKNSRHAEDIDIMVITDNEKDMFNNIDKELKEIQKTTSKKYMELK